MYFAIISAPYAEIMGPIPRKDKTFAAHHAENDPPLDGLPSHALRRNSSGRWQIDKGTKRTEVAA